MQTPKVLDEHADRIELRGAKIIYRALRLQLEAMARQVENGQDAQPNMEYVKASIQRFHETTQLEMAEWQFRELQKQNRVDTKKLGIGAYEKAVSQIRAWVLLNAGKYIKQISSTTLEQVRQQIAIGLEEGFGARKIAAEIRKEAKSPFTAYRATVIARTEGTRAASQGHLLGARMWESETGQKKWKAWSASGDSRTRDAHRAMIGSNPIPGDQKFNIGGTEMDFPGDPSGGASNVVSCRCRVVYMSERVARKMIQGKTPAGLEPVEEDKPELAQLEADYKELEKDSYFKERMQVIKKSYSDVATGLDIEARTSINAYTDKSYTEINSRLLGIHKPSKEREKYADAFTRTLNSAIDKYSDKYTGTVYRGVNIYDVSVFNKYIEARFLGNPVVEKAFVSTAKSKESQFNGNVFFKIESKKGADIQNLSRYKHEGEVLFKAGSRFKVTDFRNENGIRFIDMEEVD